MWRSMLFVGRVAGVALLIPLPFLGGSGSLRIAFAIAIVVCLVWGVVADKAITDPGRHSPRAALFLVLAVVATTWIGAAYWGVFSGVPVFIALGIYFLARGETIATAIIVFALCAGLQLVITSLILFGVIDDVGLIQRATDGRLREVLVEQCFIVIGYGIAFELGRGTRRATVRSVEDLHEAMRIAAQRDAALREAQQEIDRARRLGGKGVLSGQTLGGFALGDLLGRGAMGEVYEAVHADNGEPAAVKVLHGFLADQPDNVRRFMREARAIAALNAPNVVRIIDVGDENGVPYLAMERLVGNDLGHHLREARRFTPTRTVDLVDQVARGLAAAAEVGIVHRDIKPQNLFLVDSSDKTWKIVDFGLSKFADQSATLTRDHVVGTPAYMAPEQAASRAVDPRADVYALGAVAYRALTGHPPFAGDELLAVLTDVVAKMPRDPEGLAGVSPDVSRVLALALAKDPDDRFGTAPALAAALAAAVAGSLPADVATRADAFLRDHPWGR